ncbi:MAG TPA: TonB-dependent receptor [Candidatus Acidoferrum sp.]|nr:TonB-dependent receptor [Candidatus Acidoferrum sp.]
MKINLLRTAFLSLSVFAVSICLQAQTSSSDARVSGRLTDPSGSGIGGVRITAQLENSVGARVWPARSGEDGSYLLIIPPGRYRLHFERAAFVTRDITLDLAPSENRTLDLRLELETLSASVVVTAQPQPTPLQQTTAPVTVLTQQDLEAHQFLSLADALLFVPGVAIGRNNAEGGLTSVFLNGGNSDFTKVLVDGAPINVPGGAVDFSNLTLDDIDKVEIVRGAESALYGTDAVSGVIQLISHQGTTRIPIASFNTEGGNFSSVRGGAQLSGLLGAFDYSAAGSYFRTDGQGPNDAFLNRSLSGNFGYKFTANNQLRLSLRNNDSGAGIPGQTVFTPPSLHQGYVLHAFEANARWDFSTTSRWHHEISGSEAYNWQHSYNPQQSFFATDPNAFCPQTNPSAVATKEFCDFTYDSLFQYNRASVQAQSTYLQKDFAFTAGYQYEIENGGIYFLEAGHVRRNNQAGFLDFRYSPFSRISLNAGVRAEDNQFFGTRVVPRAGLSALLHSANGSLGDTRFRFFYGQGIKEPRFDQLYDDQFGDFGNPHLKPESSKDWTAAFEQKLSGDRILVSAEYFYTSFYNIVSFAFCTPNPPPLTGNTCDITFPNAPPDFGYYFNTDRALARGTNLSVQAHPLSWLFLVANYSYDDTRILAAPNSSDPTQQPGDHLTRRPVNSGSLSLDAAWRNFSFSLSSYFTGIRTDNDFLGLGFNHDPGYARFDVATRYNVGHGVSFYARATNLFDKFYQDALGYPALGRDIRLGLNYRFSGHN